MKYHYLSNALLGLLLIIPSAHASTTLYGRFGTEIAINTNGSQRNVITEKNASSHVGIRGEESIATDTSLEFQIESGFDGSGQAEGKLANRPTFIGAKTQYGTLRAGTNYFPTYQLFYATTGKLLDIGYMSYLQKTDTSLSQLGDMGSYIGKSIIYQSPNNQTINSALLISDANPTIAGHPASEIIDANITYKNNVFITGLGIQHAHDKLLDKNNMILILAAKYQFSPIFDIGMAYEQSRYGSLDRRKDSLFISTQYNYHAFSWIGSLGITNGDYLSGKHQAQTGAYQATFGFGYDLSKRTQLYSYVTYLHNQEKAAYQFLDNTGLGQSNRSFIFGIRHRF